MDSYNLEIGEMMRRIDYFTLFAFGGFSAGVLFNILTSILFSRYKLEGIQYFPDFLKGLTTAVGITIAVIVFLLTSILNEHPERITTTRTNYYLCGIVGSLILVIWSYWSMIVGKIEISLFSMTFAFALVFLVLFNSIAFYIEIAKE